MLKLEALSKHFGAVKAVDRVGLTIESGPMVGIIGRSGAGKSTLLRLINRLVDPTSGRIEFTGEDIARLRGKDLRRWRVRCAMIFQQFNLVDRLDVLTNVLVGRLGYHPTLPTLFRRFSRKEKAMAVFALDRLDMAHTALQRADTLSGGQQQRVAIARAMVQEPRLFLADEPIASLDPHNAAKVMDALKTINREAGITVICNLHHLDTARAYCDRIVGMRDGRIVFDGPSDSLTDGLVVEIYGEKGDEEELQAAPGKPAAGAASKEPGSRLSAGVAYRSIPTE
jgi:phosphonate transport system ATP-binding protein